MTTESQATESEMERIVASIEEYVRQISTLQGTYQFTKTPHVDESKLGPGSRVMRDQTEVIHFSADIRDGRIAIEKTRWFRYPEVSPDFFEVRSKSGFDGTRSYGLIFTPKDGPFPEDLPDPDVPFRLGISSQDPTSNDLHPLDWAGLRLRRDFDASNLAVLCRTARRSLGSERTIGGQRMPQLILEKDGHTLEVTVDPSHAYLPRAIRDVMGYSKDPAKQTEVHSLEIHEYQEAKDPGSGRRVWFPLRGTGETFTKMQYELVVQEIVLNPALEPSTFQIDLASLPPGVLVDDGSSRLLCTGNARELWESRQAKFDAHEKHFEEVPGSKRGGRSNSPATVSPATNVRVTPASPTWIFWLIGICSLGTLACGLFLMAKRR